MSLRGALTCQLVCAILLLAACSPPSHPAAPSAPVIHVDLAFTCLWWSQAQMEGLNPNAPPPKNTEVKLAKWEYSDPVGVPHPDTIDVVVTLANTGGPANVDVEVVGEWTDGALRDRASAPSVEKVTLQQFQSISVGASTSQTLRMPVDLRAKMESLAKQRQWPYGLRATVTVRAAGSAQSLAQATAELPIKPGD